MPDAEQPAISPDGARIAFTRSIPGADPRIGVASLADPGKVLMLTDDRGGVWAHEHPTWSPDGRRICYATRHGLWEVPSNGGRAKQLTTDVDLHLDPHWSPSGRHIYFTSYRDGTVALWRVSVGGRRKLKRVTLGDSRQCQPSLSSDGKRLTYATQSVTHNLVFQDLSTGQETIVRALADAGQPALSPDGSLLVFISVRAGKKLDLWLQPMREGLPTGSPRQLTAGPGDANQPSFSPDGRWIAYYQIIGQDRDLWAVPVHGGLPVRLTDNPASDMQPTWSPDGRQIAFISERGGGSHIWVLPVHEGGPAGQARRLGVESVLALAPAWSPDGKSVAFVGSDSSGNEVWMASADGLGQARRLTSGANVTQVRWDAVRGGLIACGTWGERRFGFRHLAVQGGSPIILQHSVDAGPEDSLPLFDLSADGRTLVLTREEVSGDIWLLKTQTGSY